MRDKPRHHCPWTPRELVDAMRECYGITPDMLCSVTRSLAEQTAREIYAGACHHLIGSMSYPEMARLMGRCWHSTAYACLRRFHDWPAEEQGNVLTDLSAAMVRARFNFTPETTLCPLFSFKRLSSSRQR